MLNSQYREEQHILFPSDAAGLLPVLFIVSEIIPANEELGGVRPGWRFLCVFVH